MTAESSPSKSIRPANQSWVGDLSKGPVALVGSDASITPLPGAIRLSFWVGAEDRWHVPEDEPSTRHAFPESLPISETLVRIPSGDLKIRSFGALSSGDASSAVSFDVSNGSPVPVAVAFVVESTGDANVAIERDGITVDGVTAVQFSREVADAVIAASKEELVDALASGNVAASFGESGRWLAAVMPLPHTARISGDLRSLGEGVADTSHDTAPDPVLPPIERIIEGWKSHVESAPFVDLGRDELGSAFQLARAVVAMGAGPGASLSDELYRVAARGAMGDLEGADLVLEAALRSQRFNGEISDVGSTDATVAFLAAVAGLWDAGLEPSDAQALVGPIAKAGHRLAAPRRFGRSSPEVSSEAVEAILACASMLEDLDQPEVAADFRSFVDGRFAASRLDQFQNLANAGAWTTSEAGEPQFVWSAKLVADTIHSAVATAGDTVELFSGWRPSDAGVSFDVREVPTRLGVVSCSIRWHGERPALLWEVTKRDPSSQMQVSTPALDSTWRSSDASGETLLAAPANAKRSA